MAIAVSKPTSGLSNLCDPSIHRFSVEDYHRMIDAGIFSPADKVELLDGIVVRKMGQKPPHSSALYKVMKLLLKNITDEYICRPQLPVTLSTSEPEPDLAIVLGPEERYDHRHPGATDVALIVEISDESLVRDRRDKVQLYSADRIPEYWIVNLVAGVVEVYSNPRGRRPAKFHTSAIYQKSQPVPFSLHGEKVGTLSFRDILS